MEQRISFPAGDISLEGLLSLPASPSAIGVVVCHPHPLYGGDMRNNVVGALVDRFQRLGHATLRFNFRGVGASGGEHGGGDAEVEDVKAAVTALLGKAIFQTVAVAGYSFGSMVGLRAGAADPRVHRLAGVAPPVASRDFSFLQDVSKPKLIVVGDRDHVAPLPAVRSLVDGLPAPKTLIVVNGADHFFAGLERDVADAVSAFVTA